MHARVLNLAAGLFFMSVSTWANQIVAFNYLFPVEDSALVSEAYVATDGVSYYSNQFFSYSFKPVTANQIEIVIDNFTQSGNWVPHTSWQSFNGFSFTGSSSDTAITGYSFQSNMFSSVERLPLDAGNFTLNPHGIAVDWSGYYFAPDSYLDIFLTFGPPIHPPVVAITTLGGLTNQTSQTVSGTVDVADAGTTVSLFDNGASSALATAIVQGDGSWTAQVNLAEGANQLVASDTNDGGTGTSNAVSFDVNTIAPTVTLTSAAVAGRVAAQTITGTALSGGVALAGQTVIVSDNGAVLGTAIVQTDGGFSLQATLPTQGANNLTAAVTDLYGNTGHSAMVTDLLDSTAPTVSLTSQPVAGRLAAQTITGRVVSGGTAAVAGQSVSLTDNGTLLATTIVQSDGSFSVDVALPNQGHNSLVASVSDSYGNAGASAALVDTLDSIAPSISLTSSAFIGANATQLITGHVTPGGAAAVVGQTVTISDNGVFLASTYVQADGSFSASVSLAHEGQNVITASVADSYGNLSHSASVTDVLDDVAPTVAFTSTAVAGRIAAQTISGNVTSSGVAVVGGQSVTLTDNGAFLASATVQPDGSFTADVVLPHQGLNQIVATVADSFGNSGHSAVLADVLDSIAPTITLTSPAETGRAAVQTITGDIVSGGSALVAGQAVTLTDNGAFLATAIVQADGSFSADVTLPHAGANQIIASVADSYGNTGHSTATTDTLVVGPSVADGAVLVGHDQTTDLTALVESLISPGAVGEIDTITAITGSNAHLSGGNVLYAASATGGDSFSYTVSDQFGESATAKIAVTVDPGPSLHNGAFVISPGQAVDVTSLLQSLITPGAVGEVDRITAVSGHATLNADGSVSYLAPASVGSDSFAFTVTDQFGDVATASVAVSVQRAKTTVDLSGQNNTVTGNSGISPAWGAGANINGVATGFDTLTSSSHDLTITAYGYGNTIIAGGGNDIIYAGTGGANVTVSDTNGDNTVLDSTGVTSVTLGNGDNQITLGGQNNVVTLGDGNNNVVAGSGAETVTLGNGDNTLAAQGYNNVISLGDGVNTVNAGAGDDTITVAGGVANIIVGGHNDRITIAGGQVSLSGIFGDAHVTLGANFGASATDSLDLAGAGGDSFTDIGGVVTILNADRSIYATVTSASGNGLIAFTTPSGDLIITAGDPAPAIAGVMSESQGGQVIALAAPTTSLHLVGTGNIVTSDSGSYTIDGAAGASQFHLGAGNNVLVVGGYDNTISLGDGDSSISGIQGSSVVQVGNGDSTISLHGLGNQISTGSGSSVIQAGDGADVVTTNAGDDIVTLNGSGNIVYGGLGHDVISGGQMNTYALVGLSSTGQLDIAGFNVGGGDVLDLSAVTSTLDAGWSLAGQVDVQDASALDVLLTTAGGVQYHVATLHGTNASLTSLLDSHAVIV